MNRILLSFCLIAFVSANAQTKTTKELLLDTICKCVTNKKEDLKKSTPEDLQKQVQICFISEGFELILKYAKEQNVDYSDEDAMEKLGVGLGVELVKTCPSFIELSMYLAMSKKDKPDSADKKISTEKPAKIDLTNYTEGTVLRVNTTSFPASIEIKQKDGTIKKVFLVSEYYAQEDKYFNTANLIGKKLGFQTEPQKIFNPSTKKFETFEVLLIISIPK